MTDQYGRYAVLADIHGNAVALDAVLGECAVAGIDRFIVPGDLAWGPHPWAVVERIIAMGDRATVIRGNADREVADPSEVDLPDLRESTEWCAAQLTAGKRAWLGELPLSAIVPIPGLGEVLVCHGTPESDTGRLRPDLEPDAAPETLTGVTASVVICGHSHVRFDVTVGDWRLVNPGSVGLHYGVAEAQWAILGPAGITMRTTAYDRERAARLAGLSGIPGAADFAAFYRDPLA